MLRMNSKTDAQLLDERIAEIRKKNEERHKRFLEVEADKQNAAKANALVQLSAPKEKWYDGRTLSYNEEPRKSGSNLQEKANLRNSRGQKFGENINEDEAEPLHKLEETYGNTKPQKEAKPSRQSELIVRTRQNTDKKSSQPKVLKHLESNVAKIQTVGKMKATVNSSGAKCYTFAEGDGPPPDPVYSFLADAERDPVRVNHGKSTSRGREGGRSSARSRHYTDRDLRYTQASEDPHSRSQYEAWKAERDRIDQERINRQKTADGQWRREWDRGKVILDLNEVRTSFRGRGRGGVRREKSGFNLQTHGPPASQSFASGDGDVEISKSTPPESSERSKRINHRGCRGASPNWSVPHNAGAKRQNQERPDRIGIRRNVKDMGNSLQINVSTSPLQRVKANARNVVGTGRVGPRQNVRVSYSSQSEDEACFLMKNEQRSLVKQTPPIHSMNNASAAKPPRPPLSHCTEEPKSRRNKENRLKRRRGVGRMDSTRSCGSSDTNAPRMDIHEQTVEKEAISTNQTEQGNESGDEDSWEDLTTSGNESACDLVEDTKTSPCQHSDDAKDEDQSNIATNFHIDDQTPALYQVVAAENSARTKVIGDQDDTCIDSSCVSNVEQDTEIVEKETEMLSVSEEVVEETLMKDLNTSQNNEPYQLEILNTDTELVKEQCELERGNMQTAMTMARSTSSTDQLASD